MNPMIFGLLVFGVMLNATAQLLLKAGVNRIGEFDFQFSNIVPIGWQVATNFPIMLGLSTYVASVVIWLIVLSRVDVSVAYPMLSLGYIVTAIASYYFLTEPLSAMRIAGIFVILMGVFMIARS